MKQYAGRHRRLVLFFDQDRIRSGDADTLKNHLEDGYSKRLTDEAFSYAEKAVVRVLHRRAGSVKNRV